MVSSCSCSQTVAKLIKNMFHFFSMLSYWQTATVNSSMWLPRSFNHNFIQSCDTRAHTKKPIGFIGQIHVKNTPNLIRFQFPVPQIMKRFIMVKFLTLNLWICKFLDIYLMLAVSSSAHSNNLKCMKTPKPKVEPFKSEFNPKKIQNQLGCTFSKPGN